MLKELADDYFEKQKKTIKRYSEAVLSLFAEESGKDIGLPTMTEEIREKASAAIEYMVNIQGYPRPSIPEVLAALLKARY